MKETKSFRPVDTSRRFSEFERERRRERIEYGLVGVTLMDMVRYWVLNVEGRKIHPIFRDYMN